MSAPTIRLLLPFLTALLLGLGACKKDPVRPDPTVQDLVGDWEATSLLVTSVAASSVSVDILAQGASFFINVQPSGSYTSSLVFQGTAFPELGELEVDGDRLILRVQVATTGPRVDTAQFELSGDRLEIQGPTLFDFNLDGLVEPATLDAVLQR
jgi:hypothetical protein